MEPESSYLVSVNETGVSCRLPGGGRQSLSWSRLIKVTYRTTSTGPFLPDQWWVLFDGSRELLIPWGATGEKALRRRLEALPGVQPPGVEEVLCTEDRDFVCWTRPEGPSGSA